MLAQSDTIVLMGVNIDEKFVPEICLFVNNNQNCLDAETCLVYGLNVYEMLVIYVKGD